ncbi:hypothetical protein AB0O67_17170 [Streptomyces sp. NPDC086077]|uniref:hypothetical protein n=1 Tax=Streptomyces sp. NPDC086077 TaxID=3154862 RepID=UPI0034412653
MSASHFSLPQAEGEMTDLVTEAVDELALRCARYALPEPAGPDDRTGSARHEALAQLLVLVQVERVAQQLADRAARAAAAAGAGYPEIGRASGMSRQGARRRWPGLITSATPRHTPSASRSS